MPAITSTGTSVPLESVFIGGSDGSHLQGFQLRNSTPNSSDFGLVVRPLGSLIAKPQVASTANVTRVASSGSDTQLLAANSNRLGFILYNESTQILYLKYGSSSSLTSYSVQILAGGYYEDPFHGTGQINGFWASANGAAQITEFSP